MDLGADDSQGALLVVQPPRQLETLVSRLLRSGVAVATLLICAGTAITFARHPDYRSSAEPLKVLLAPGATRPAASLLASLPELRGQAFILAGLIVLVATPIARVALTSAFFFRRGERRLAGFGLAVLLLLAVSFALGLAEG